MKKFNDEKVTICLKAIKQNVLEYHYIVDYISALENCIRDLVEENKNREHARGICERHEVDFLLDY